MPEKPIELPPDVAKAFVKDMRAYQTEPSAIKRDEIASRQVHVPDITAHARKSFAFMT